ncbi:MAG: 3'-5' exonuclease [Thaumarchaeota archaeon]|nr:3'-5' exonuclease [Nitrososphaerota archaeon]
MGNTKAGEIYISVDVETSGPIPGEYSMLSIGACVVGDISKTFYREIKPVSDKFVPEAVEVNGLSLQKLKETGTEPAVAMRDFGDWVGSVSNERRPVFVAFNATFDWMFVAYYFHKFLGRNPFGISGLDIKAYYMGKFRTSWSETVKKRLDKRVISRRKHTHNALDDAIEQAEIFGKILEFGRNGALGKGKQKHG